MQMQAKADDARRTAAAASAGGRERIMVRRLHACQGESARVEHEWAPFYCAVDAGMLLLFPCPDAVEAEILKSRCSHLILYTNWARALTSEFLPRQAHRCSWRATPGSTRAVDTRRARTCARSVCTLSVTRPPPRPPARLLSPARRLPHPRPMQPSGSWKRQIRCRCQYEAEAKADEQKAREAKGVQQPQSPNPRQPWARCLRTRRPLVAPTLVEPTRGRMRACKIQSGRAR
jgi:hypothetical protein